MGASSMDADREVKPDGAAEAAAGAAVYSKPLLSFYDLFVLGISNRFFDSAAPSGGTGGCATARGHVDQRGAGAH